MKLTNKMILDSINNKNLSGIPNEIYDAVRRAEENASLKVIEITHKTLHFWNRNEWNIFCQEVKKIINPHGGTRPGAGRPKSEPTVTISFRVKVNDAEDIKKQINAIIQATKKACKTTETEKKFLQDAGII